MKGFMNDTL